MENHIITRAMARKLWNLVRVFLLMARKGICNKRKHLLYLNPMLKCGQIAGKALVGNLIFHYHPHRNHPTASTSSSSASLPGEYKFSCSNTHSHVHHVMNFLHHLQAPFHVGGSKHRKSNKTIKPSSSQGPDDTAMKSPELFFDDENYEEVSRVLEMLALNDEGFSSSSNINNLASYYSSPAYNLPELGFGRSPMVRQLRVTDSPFPLATHRDEDDRRVDEAADEFIKRFYSQLRQQSLMSPGPDHQ